MLLHELFSMLEKENTADYVIYPDTGRIIYMNHAALEYTPSVREGDLIFRSMCGRSGYCSYCCELKDRLSEKPVSINPEALCSYANVTVALFDTEKGAVLVSRWDESGKYTASVDPEAYFPENVDKTVSDEGNTPGDADILESCGLIDVQGALESLDGDRTIYDGIARTYYEDGFVKLQQIRQYFEENDLSNLRITVHGLKSASYIIGANSLADLAKKLEFACRDIVDADKDLGDILRSTPDEAQDILNENILKVLHDYNSVLKIFARYYNDPEGLAKLEDD